MGLPRLTTRRLMMVVTVAAIVLEGVWIRVRASDYQLKADLFGMIESIHRDGLDPELCYLAKGSIPHPMVADYYLQMQRKYERAARFPGFLSDLIQRHRIDRGFGEAGGLPGSCWIT